MGTPGCLLKDEDGTNETNDRQECGQERRHKDYKHSGDLCFAGISCLLFLYINRQQSCKEPHLDWSHSGSDLARLAASETIGGRLAALRQQSLGRHTLHHVVVHLLSPVNKTRHDGLSKRMAGLSKTVFPLARPHGNWTGSRDLATLSGPLLDRSGPAVLLNTIPLHIGCSIADILPLATRP